MNNFETNPVGTDKALKAAEKYIALNILYRGSYLIAMQTKSEISIAQSTAYGKQLDQAYADYLEAKTERRMTII